MTNDRYRAMRAASFELLTIPHCPVDPTAAQCRFLLDLAPEALYGGAAGGGKSIALLMGGLQFVDVPGYRALVLRRTLTELQQPGGLLDVATSWLSAAARWQPATYTFNFPAGSSLTFGYLDHENAKLRYQGLEFQYVGFDELTHFAETQYTYLFSRLRRPAGDSPVASIPLRMRAGTNPGGPGTDWVHRRFIEPWTSHGQMNAPESRRHFYPAKMADNPHLDAVTYRQSLEQLDPVTRAQLRDGDWDIRPSGRMFRPDWFELVDASRVPDRCDTVRFCGRDRQNARQRPRLYGWGARQLRPPGQVLLPPRHPAATRHRRQYRASHSPDRRARRTVGSDSHRRGTRFRGQDRHPPLPDNSAERVERPWRTSDRAQDRTRRTVRGESRARRSELVRAQWNEAFLDEAVLFPDGGHDDQVDVVAGAMTVLSRRPHYDNITIPVNELSRDNPWRQC